MDFLKELFGDKPLTFDELSNAVKEKGLKLADLSSGGYVDKDKFLKIEKEYKATKANLDDLSSAIDGDDGLKKKIKMLEAEKNDFETKFSQTSKELTEMKNFNKVIGAGVKSDMGDFVAYKVSKMTSDDVDFDKALTNFLKDNPHYTSKEGAPRVRTSPNMGGGDTDGAKSINEKMNNILLKATGREK